MIILRFFLILLSFWLFPCQQNAKKHKDFVICTWNIGHFSKGKKHYSLIRKDDYKRQLDLYRSFIFNELCPDLLAVNEYNYLFCEEDNEGDDFVTSSLLFDNFKKGVIGSHEKGICNAIFSNVKIKKHRFVKFEGHKKIEGDDEIKTRDNYFIESDLYISGKKIKLVCLHLLFSNNVKEVIQQSQMEELINRYSRIDRVIMCGDWNTGIYTSLKNAGYALANDGSLKTYPSSGYALDNIAVKGLYVSDVRMVKTELSDHYPLVCRITMKKYVL